MVDLIENFPKKRRCIKDRAGTKKVHFSPTSTLLLMESSDTILDVSDAWHSGKEYEEFRRANVEAVREVQRGIRAQDEKQIVLDDRDVTGIENLLTAKLIKKTMGIRMLHRSAILQEQARQHTLGEYDADRLAYLSAHLSTWSVQRSLEIAATK